MVDGTRARVGRVSKLGTRKGEGRGRRTTAAVRALRLLLRSAQRDVADVVPRRIPEDPVEGVPGDRAAVVRAVGGTGLADDEDIVLPGHLAPGEGVARESRAPCA